MNTQASLVSLLIAASALAACGGGALPPEAVTTFPAAPPEAQLLRDEWGRKSLGLAELAPRDTAARTRNGLYATRDQYEWEALTMAPVTVLVDVDDLVTVAAAVQYAHHVRDFAKARGLTFFVRARDPVRAAQVVNTLSDAGFAPVVMIV